MPENENPQLEAMDEVLELTEDLTPTLGTNIGTTLAVNGGIVFTITKEVSCCNCDKKETVTGWGDPRGWQKIGENEWGCDKCLAAALKLLFRMSRGRILNE